jgi:nucleoside diphosphate kinase
MKIKSELSKYKKLEPYIIDIVKGQNIKNVSRLILGESHGELTVIILTENHMRSEYMDKVRENIQRDLIDYMGIDILIVFIDKVPAIS